MTCTSLLGATLLWGQGNKGPGTGGPEEQLGAVRSDLAAMDNGQKRVEQMYKKAKRQKDIIRTSCVHEKLVRIKNYIALAREQFSRYLMERASGESTTSVPLRQKISMFKERVDEMVAEAEQCAGEAIRVTDKPQVTEEIDPKIPQKDPTQPGGSIWVMPRPPEGSPYF
ncbi:MAG: hypothetical protein ABI333_25425 [bacterium]